MTPLIPAAIAAALLLFAWLCLGRDSDDGDPTAGAPVTPETPEGLDTVTGRQYETDA